MFFIALLSLPKTSPIFSKVLLSFCISLIKVALQSSLNEDQESISVHKAVDQPSSSTSIQNKLGLFLVLNEVMLVLSTLLKSN